MDSNFFSDEQKVAIVLMNLPPAETAEVWEQLSTDERQYFSQVYQQIPSLTQVQCDRVMLEMMHQF